MRYTPQGRAVTSFGVATNRRWVSEGAEREEVEFHNVVAWGKLAEICNEFLKKGRKVYIQGRLQTRSWEGSDRVKRTRTEIVAEDMVALDSRRPAGEAGRAAAVSTVSAGDAAKAVKKEAKEKDGEASGRASKSKQASSEEVEAGEIPF